MPIALATNDRSAINAGIRRATFAAHRQVEQLDAATLKDLQGLYKQAAADLAERISAHAGPDGNLALQEMQNVLAQVNARLRELSQARDALLAQGLEAAADIGVKPYTAAAGVEVLSVAGAMRVSNEALNFVRTFVAEDGLQLSDRIWRLDRGARDAVVNAIEMAVIQGHGASQAAAEFLARGVPVPPELRDKAAAAGARGIGKKVGEDLLAGTGAPMDNAMRLFRTEINRAHGEAYMMGGEDIEGFAGWRYLLSPAHPKPDICDLLSTQNVHGLGPGVYPSREKCPWPAHPNTLSFVEIVFEDEITAADRSGKETPIQALDRLPAAQRKGVLGLHKNQAWNEGKLTQGMIRAPWRSVKLRTGDMAIVTPIARVPVAAAAATARNAVSDAIGWLRDNVADRVALRGAPADVLRSITEGFKAVLLPAQARVGSIGWIRGPSKTVNAQYRHLVFGHNPGANDGLEFSRAYAMNATSMTERAQQAFTESRSAELGRLKALLDAPGRSPASRAAIEGQLAQVHAVRRWSAASSAADPLFVTAAHESGHALYFSNYEVAQSWTQGLAAARVDRIDLVRVSQYGASQPTELFAEVTALIADGKRGEIPEKILRAYDAAMKKVK